MRLAGLLRDQIVIDVHTLCPFLHTATRGRRFKPNLSSPSPAFYICIRVRNR